MQNCDNSKKENSETNELIKLLAKADSTLKSGATAIPADVFNPDNWVSPVNILKNLSNPPTKGIFTKGCTPKYPVEILERPMVREPDENTMYLLCHCSHYYIILFLVADKIGYVADGLNLALNDGETFNKVASCFPFKLHPIPSYYQRALDHSGSSAVVIGLAFNKFFNIGHKIALITRLELPKTIKDRIVSTLHKFESQSVRGRRNISDKDLSFYKCFYCPKQIRRPKYQAFHSHLQRCKELLENNTSGDAVVNLE